MEVPTRSEIDAHTPAGGDGQVSTDTARSPSDRVRGVVYRIDSGPPEMLGELDEPTSASDVVARFAGESASTLEVISWARGERVRIDIPDAREREVSPSGEVDSQAEPDVAAEEGTAAWVVQQAERRAEKAEARAERLQRQLDQEIDRRHDQVVELQQKIQKLRETIADLRSQEDKGAMEIAMDHVGPRLPEIMNNFAKALESASGADSQGRASRPQLEARSEPRSPSPRQQEAGPRDDDRRAEREAGDAPGVTGDAEPVGAEEEASVIAQRVKKNEMEQLLLTAVQSLRTGDLSDFKTMLQQYRDDLTQDDWIELAVAFARDATEMDADPERAADVVEDIAQGFEDYLSMLERLGPEMAAQTLISAAGVEATRDEKQMVADVLRELNERA